MSEAVPVFDFIERELPSQSLLNFHLFISMQLQLNNPRGLTETVDPFRAAGAQQGNSAAFN